jgi:hypothetical protein
MFGKHWESATGTVVDKRVAGTTSGGADAVVKMEFIVDVQLLTGHVFRAKVDALNAADFWAPKIGQSVRVEVEQKSNDVRFDKSDLGISFKEYKRAQAASFDVALAQPAGTPSPHAGPAAPGYAIPGGGAAQVMAGMGPEQIQAMVAAALAGGGAMQMQLPEEAKAALRAALQNGQPPAL